MSKPFTDTLREIRKGAVVDALTDELTSLVEAVKATNKPGSITLKLTLKPQGRDAAQVEVIPNVSVSTPTADLAKGIFFIDGDCQLVRDDPDQAPLFDDASALGGRRNRGPAAIAD